MPDFANEKYRTDTAKLVGSVNDMPRKLMKRAPAPKLVATKAEPKPRG